jgi:pSer/pThr/pTyr-binding forkhead associated (FHA) protein
MGPNKSNRVFVISEVISNPGKARPRKMVLAERELVFGRSEQADFCVYSPTVSRRHAALWIENGIARIKDLGSSHGTFVNSSRIREATSLRQGDLVALGRDAIFLLSAEEGAEIQALERAAIAEEKNIGDSALEELALSDTSPPALVSEYLDVLGELTLVCRSAVREGEVYRAVVASLAKVLEADRVVILLGSDANQLTIGARKLRVPDLAEQWRPLSKSILRRALLSEKATISFDAQSDQRFGDRTSIAMSSIRSAICIGLTAGADTLGVLYADNQMATGQFTVSDAILIQVAAQLVTQTVLKLRMRSSFSEVGQDRTKELELLNNALAAVQDLCGDHAMELQRIAKHIEDELTNPVVADMLRDQGEHLALSLTELLSWRQDTTHSRRASGALPVPNYDDALQEEAEDNIDTGDVKQINEELALSLGSRVDASEFSADLGSVPVVSGFNVAASNDDHVIWTPSSDTLPPPTLATEADTGPLAQNPEDEDKPT